MRIGVISACICFFLPRFLLGQEVVSKTQENLHTIEQTASIVVFDRILFGPGSDLPRSVQAEIINQTKSHQWYDDHENSWLQELLNAGIIVRLQELGYFRVKALAEPHLLKHDSRSSHYKLEFTIDLGPRYALGNIEFKNVEQSRALVFPSAQLRNLFDLRRGNLFNISTVREGMEKITRLYSTRGYIDCTVEPETHENENGSIDVVISIDEEQPYHVGQVQFVGIPRGYLDRLQPQLVIGDIFDQSLIDQILRQNKRFFPKDVSSGDESIIRNTVIKTVDVRFDFCRENCNGLGVFQLPPPLLRSRTQN